MGSSRTYLILLLFFLLFSGPSLSQDITPNEKAARYHAILQKKPDNATLFSRFVQSWFDTDSKENLQKWLEQSTSNGTHADWQILASLHDYLGQDQAALRSLNEAVKTAPDSATLRLTRAKLHARLLDFEAALRDLETASSDPKIGTEASKLQGIYLARAGRIEEALNTWNALAKKLPKDEELREDLIEIQVIEGLFKEATTTAQELVAMTRDPYQKTLRQLRLGDLQILNKDREAGLSTYQSIVANTGADSWLEREVLAQIERTFTRDDDHKGLRDFYQKLNAAHPRRLSIRKALAHQMAANNESDEAIALFREILKITPGDLGNREEFITFLESAKKWQLAHEELNELIKQRPADPALWEHLLRLETSLKNPAGIKAALLEIKKIRGQSPDGLIAVATLYQQAKLLPEAQKILRNAHTSFPDSDEVTEALASFLISNDAEEEALTLWKKMAAGAARDGLLRVARSLSSHGKKSEAFQLLSSRHQEDRFAEDPLFITQLCQLAGSTEEATTAIPIAQKLIALAQAPTELENAVRLTRNLIIRAQKTPDILAKKPSNIGEKCLHASLIAKLGDLPRALRILEEASASDPTELAQFFHIRFQEEFGNPDSAITLLRKIIAAPGGKKTIHYRRLTSLLESNGDLPAALSAVEQWKKIAPGDKSAWFRRANLLLTNQEPEKAATELRRLIGKFGADEENRSLLAKALLQNEELRPARQIYQRLYEEADDLPAKLKWISSLAQIAEQDDSIDQLLADFERRKRANPTSVAPLLALAEIHREQGNYEQRRSALLEASRRRPNDLALLLNLASEEERYGEFERAISILNDALKNDSGATIKRRLANLHLRCGEIQTGLRILGEIPGENDDPRNLEATVIALFTGRELIAATHHLESHLNKHHEDWRLHYLYGILLDLNQDYLRSIEILSTLHNTTLEISGLKPILSKKGNQPSFFWTEPIKGTPLAWPELKHLEEIIQSEKYNLRRLLTGRTSSNSSPIHLPGSAREARIMSVIRAAHTAKSLAHTSKERKAILSSLNLPEIPSFPLFKALHLTWDKQQELIDIALKKDPDSLFFQNLWINQAFENPEQTNKAKIAANLHALAQKSPTLAAQTFQQNTQYGNIAEAELFSYFEIILNATPVTLLPDFLNNYSYLPGALEYYSKDIQNKVSALFLPHIFRLKKTPQDLDWINSPLQHTITEQKVDDTIKLLNFISRRPPEKQHILGSSNLFYNYYNRGKSHVFIPPPFPNLQDSRLPRALNINISQQLSKSDNSEALEQQKILAQIAPELAKNTAEGPLAYLRGHEEKIEDPFTRDLLTAALSPQDKLPELIVKFSNSTDHRQLFFAAGYLFDQGEFLKTNHILERLHLLPLSRQARAKLDGNLAHLGAILQSRKTPNFDPSPAIKAALRLRRHLHADEHKFLTQHLIALGQESEAQKINKASPSPRNRYPRSSSSSAPTGRYGIIAHIIAGDRKAAIREGVKTLIGELRGGFQNSNMRRTIGILRSTEIADEILEKLTPNPDASLTKRIQYAKLSEVMGRPDLALPLYKKLLKETPENHELIAEILTLSPLTEWPNKEIPPEALRLLLTKIKHDFEKMMQLSKLTSELLEQNPQNDSSLAWASSLLQIISSNTSYGLTALPHLFGSPPSEFSISTDLEAEKKRKHAFLRLSRAMLKHADLCSHAFSQTSRSNRRLKIPAEELTAMARDSLLTIIHAQKQEDDYSMPAIFIEGHAIGEHLLKNANPDLLFLDSTLEALAKNYPKDAQRLTLIRALSQQTEEEKLTSYQKWQETLPSNQEEKIGELEKLSFLLSHLQPPYGPWADLFQAQLLALASDSPNSERAQAFADWTKFLYQSPQAQRAIEFLITLFEAQLSPQEKWPLYAKLNFYQAPQKIKTQISFCAAVVGHINKNKNPSLSLALECLLTEGSLTTILGQASSNLNTRGYNRRDLWRRDNDSAEKLTALLAEMGILKNDHSTPPSTRALLIMKASPYLTNPSSLQKLILAQPDQHPSLVKILLASCLTDKEGKFNPKQFTKEDRELIKECAKKAPTTVINFLEPFLENTPLKNLHIETRQALHQDILKETETWSTQGIPLSSPTSQGYHLWPKIKKLTSHDPELCADYVEQIFLKLGKWPKAQQAIITPGSTSPIIDNWFSSYLENLFRYHLQKDPVQEIVALDRLLRSKVMNFLTPSIYNVQYNRYGGFNTITTASLYNDSIFESLKTSAQKLTPQQQMSFILWAFNSNHFPHLSDTASPLKIINAIEEELGEVSPLFADALSYYYLSLTYHQLSQSEKSTSLQHLQEIQKNLLSKNDFPVTSRLLLINTLATRHPVKAEFFREPSFAKQCLNVLITYHQTHRHPSTDPTFTMLNHLTQVDENTHPDWSSHLIERCLKDIIIPFESRRQLQNILLPLALKAERPDLVRKWVLAYPEDTIEQCERMLDLAEAGYHDLIKKIIPSSPEQYRSNFHLRFRKDWEEKIPQLLSLLPEDHRLRLTDFFALRKDAEAPHTPITQYEERLTKIATQSPLPLPKDPRKRILKLNALSSGSLPRTRILHSLLSKEIGTLNLEMITLAQQEGNSRSLAQSLSQTLTQLTLLDLADGKIDSALHHYKSLSNSRRYNNSSSASAGDTFMKQCFPEIIKRALLSPADAQKMATFSREIFDLSFHFEDSHNEVLSTSLALVLSTHALSGDFTTWEKHLAQQSLTIQNWTRHYLTPSENYYQSHPFFPLREYPETEQKLLKTLLTSTWIQTHIWHTPKAFPTLSHMTIADPKALRKALTQLPDSSPIKESFLKEISD